MFDSPKLSFAMSVWINFQMRIRFLIILRNCGIIKKVCPYLQIQQKFTFYHMFDDHSVHKSLGKISLNMRFPKGLKSLCVKKSPYYGSQMDTELSAAITSHNHVCFIVLLF